jgi:hypothetical protein
MKHDCRDGGPRAVLRILRRRAYSGLSFYGGIALPAWADNSNSTGNNPDGALSDLDISTAAVTPAATP